MRGSGDAGSNAQNPECTSDAQCTTGKNGRCMVVGSRVRENRCTYDACTVDADCKTGGPCECSATGNVCLPGNCRTDADCGTDGSCGRSNPMCGEGEPSYYCRTPNDTCVDYDDCDKGSRCLYVPEVGHYTCQKELSCPVG